LSSPYVILKSAMSIDGYIDDCTSERLLLSNEADFQRVDQVRSECDAILVGAGTIRIDNPSLLVKSKELQHHRIMHGLPIQPAKVTITATGSLPKDSKFFTTGEGKKVVYCASGSLAMLTNNLKGVANVDISNIEDLNPQSILNDLGNRDIKKLLIEGGAKIATSFLVADAVDELQISIAPFFVGEENAPRLSNANLFPHNSKKPMRLHNIERLGDVVLLTYLLDRQPGTRSISQKLG
jgi:5-amino-6-(5-phosphoribosylamino)uracil reductase